MKNRGVVDAVGIAMIVLISIVSVGAIAGIAYPLISDINAGEDVSLTIETSEGYTFWDPENMSATVQVSRGSDGGSTSEKEVEKIKVVFYIEDEIYIGYFEEDEIPSVNGKKTKSFDFSDKGKPSRVTIIPMYKEREGKQVSSINLVIEGTYKPSGGRSSGGSLGGGPSDVYEPGKTPYECDFIGDSCGNYNFIYDASCNCVPNLFACGPYLDTSWNGSSGILGKSNNGTNNNIWDKYVTVEGNTLSVEGNEFVAEYPRVAKSNVIIGGIHSGPNVIEETLSNWSIWGGELNVRLDVNDTQYPKSTSDIILLGGYTNRYQNRDLGIGAYRERFLEGYEGNYTYGSLNIPCGNLDLDKSGSVDAVDKLMLNMKLNGADYHNYCPECTDEDLDIDMSGSVDASDKIIMNMKLNGILQGICNVIFSYRYGIYIKAYYNSVYTHNLGHSHSEEDHVFYLTDKTSDLIFPEDEIKIQWYLDDNHRLFGRVNDGEWRNVSTGFNKTDYWISNPDADFERIWLGVPSTLNQGKNYFSNVKIYGPDCDFSSN